MTEKQSSLLAASSRVALAAFLHDLGKFAERADMEVGVSARDAHVQLYCPFRTTDASGKRGYHTHKHAAYTAIAFDLIERTAPDLIHGDMTPFANRAADRDQITDSLVNAAAAHHKPETFLQWIIATADRVASGFERDEFEKYNRSDDTNPETGRNHYQARQLTLFEKINRPGKHSAASYRHRLPLEAMSPASIFPQARADCEPAKDAPARAEYAALWQEFLLALEQIPTSHRTDWPLWLDHFDTAWMCFTHAIPAATAFGIKPDVSLYDHSKSTAALAVALWRWHLDQQQTGAEAARRLERRSDWDEDKLLLIQGDFFGIQTFVFADGAQTSKGAARLLRGRSFQVSLFTELAALKVLEALALPPTSQILNAAGKFLIVAPNTDAVRTRLAAVQREVDDWFLAHGFGLAGLGLVTKPATCNDFVKGRFKTLMQSLFQELEKGKLQRFDLMAVADPVFAVRYPNGVCRYNARLPADQSGGGASAALSRDQLRLGQQLTRHDRLLILRDPKLRMQHDLTMLELPIFGMGVALASSREASSHFAKLAQQGQLLRCWDFSLPSAADDTLWHGFARRSVNAYVPRFSQQDMNTADKYTALEHGDDEPDEMHVGSGKSFGHIACEDRSCARAAGSWRGQVALIALKGDVDNLGAIFQNGLEDVTFAKMAALSRQMNAFFSIWLPAVCAAEFPNTYTVFAGGDDFFLIGPWLSTQRLAARMAAEFRRYVADNETVTFSAGMVMTKPATPIDALASQTEEALTEAKGTDKNAVLLFGERVRWPEWQQIEAAQQQLARICDSYELSSGYVYGVLNLIDLATDQKNGESAMWRSRFAYRTRRYVVDRLEAPRRSAAQADLAEHIGEKGIARLGSRYRIPLFNYFYQQR